jgi:hypothetical protein
VIFHPSLGRQQQAAVRSKKRRSPRFVLVSKMRVFETVQALMSRCGNCVGFGFALPEPRSEACTMDIVITRYRQLYGESPDIDIAEVYRRE